NSKLAMILRPSIPVAGLTWNAGLGGVTHPGDPPPQTILSGAASSPLLAIGQMVCASTGTIATRTTVPAMNEVVGPDGGRHYAHWLAQVPGDFEDITYDWTPSGTTFFSTIQSGYLTFTLA